jgi:hypothetical protein
MRYLFKSISFIQENIFNTFTQTYVKHLHKCIKTFIHKYETLLQKYYI